MTRSGSRVRQQWPAAQLERVRRWAPDVAIVLGSGMAALADDVLVEQVIDYAALGWPRTAVPGHDNRLLLAKVATAGGRELKLALACGRPHRYEGWTTDELERPVRSLAAVGVRRLVLTNASGGLRAVPAGALVICDHLVDLQSPPAASEPERLPICGPLEMRRVAALETPAPALLLAGGTYVSVLGPQFETPAEAVWLSGYGDAVGMSAAPEIRAAQATGVAAVLLALVVNRAAEVASHEDVLSGAEGLIASLRRILIPLITARWPKLA